MYKFFLIPFLMVGCVSNSEGSTSEDTTSETTEENSEESTDVSFGDIEAGFDGELVLSESTCEPHGDGAVDISSDCFTPWPLAVPSATLNCSTREFEGELIRVTLLTHPDSDSTYLVNNGARALNNRTDLDWVELESITSPDLSNRDLSALGAQLPACQG